MGRSLLFRVTVSKRPSTTFCANGAISGPGDWARKSIRPSTSWPTAARDRWATTTPAAGIAATASGSPAPAATATARTAWARARRSGRRRSANGCRTAPTSTSSSPCPKSCTGFSRPTTHWRQVSALIPDSTGDSRRRLSRRTCRGSGSKAASSSRSRALTR